MLINDALQSSLQARERFRMVEPSAVFVWYELLTTDVPAAQSFYR
jgi:hypothetical protein